MKIGEPEENPQSKARTNNKLNPPGGNRALATTMVGGERSHHCAEKLFLSLKPRTFQGLPEYTADQSLSVTSHNSS